MWIWLGRRIWHVLKSSLMFTERLSYYRLNLLCTTDWTLQLTADRFKDLRIDTHQWSSSGRLPSFSSVTVQGINGFLQIYREYFVHVRWLIECVHTQMEGLITRCFACFRHKQFVGHTARVGITLLIVYFHNVIWKTAENISKIERRLIRQHKT